MSENFRGAILMMVCMGAFVLNDAFVRLAGNTVPLAQILFLRGILTTTLLLIFALYIGVFKLRVSRKDKWKISDKDSINTSFPSFINKLKEIGVKI